MSNILSSLPELDFSEGKLTETQISNALTARGYKLLKCKNIYDSYDYAICYENGMNVAGIGTREYTMTLDDVQKWIKEYDQKYSI